MTVPSLAECENEVVLDKSSSFKERPLTNASIAQWKLYYEKEGLILSDDEIIKKVQSDPSPDEHDKILQDNKIAKEKKKDFHSDYIKAIIKQVGITSDMDWVIDSTENDKEMESLNGISKTSSRLFWK